MFEKSSRASLHFIAAAVALCIFALPAPSAFGGEYAALDGVKGVKVVFDVSLGSAKAINAVFGAVRNVYEDASVRALPEAPKAVVVFHGPALNLISTERKGFSDAEKRALEKFADTIREMKKEGVKFEVCMYAAKMMGINPDTFLPEIDRVGNGFISIVGYQAKGYSLVPIG